MATFGDTTPGSAGFPNSGDRALASKYTLSEGATLNTAYAYIHSGSAGGNAKVLIYSDGGANPGTLIAASAGAAITGVGWMSCGAISGSLVAGDYYLVFVGDANSYPSYIGDDNGSGPNLLMANGTLSYASPPSSWPGTDADYGPAGVNVYIDYTASGGGLIPRAMLLGAG